MIVKSRNPIRTVNINVNPNASFSYADDAKKTGYFSKAEREKRKKERGVRQKERKDDRITTRIERRKNRKAKYGSRPLNPFSKGGKQFWKDKLPKLKKKENGDFEKTMPDGSIVIVKGKDVTIIPAPKGAPAGTPPLAVEKAELKTGGQIATEKVNGEVVITNTYTESQTEKATDDKGQEQVYKKADVVDEGSPDAKKPMSTGLKVGLAVGGAALLGLVIYVLVKKK